MAIVVCVCGHNKHKHANDSGQCSRTPCECETFVELCPQCKHRRSYHEGTGQCTVEITRRWVKNYGDDCACEHYKKARPTQGGS